jgi:hypothetical protein
VSDVEQQLERTRTEALRAYAPVHGEEQVGATFDAVLAEFAAARVRAFVPVLAERRLREQLAAVQPAEVEPAEDPLSGGRG